MLTKSSLKNINHFDRFIPVREADSSSKDLHHYETLTQKTDELIAEAIAADSSLRVITNGNDNLARLSQLALTQHKRTSFLIEKIMPQQRKLLNYSKKSLRIKPKSFMIENDKHVRDLWKKKKRFKVKKKPIKILEAPGLMDDYYLNLVVWGQTNIIGVGLEDCVYLYNFSKNKVIKHFDCSSVNKPTENRFSLNPFSYVCSMSFNSSGTSLAIADSTGKLSITDISTKKIITSEKVHNARIGSLHWQNNLLVSGSRDSCVNLFDPRKSLNSPIHSFKGHKQEICGLKLSSDNRFIASGGNDNDCFLWSLKKMKVSIYIYFFRINYFF